MNGTSPTRRYFVVSTPDAIAELTRTVHQGAQLSTSYLALLAGYWSCHKAIVVKVKCASEALRKHLKYVENAAKVVLVCVRHEGHLEVPHVQSL